MKAFIDIAAALNDAAKLKLAPVCATVTPTLDA